MRAVAVVRIMLVVAACIAVSCAEAEATAGFLQRDELASAAGSIRHWHALGGETTLWFNRGAIEPLGMRVVRAEANRAEAAVVGDYVEYRFAIDDTGALAFRQVNGVFSRLEPGVVRHRGGPVLELAAGELDLRGFQLQRREGRAGGLILADRAGTAWFSLDHAHYFVDDRNRLSLRHMDLRVTAELATRLGRPEWKGTLVGGAQVDSARAKAAVARIDPAAAAGTCDVTWPSASAWADVQMLHLSVNWEEREPDGVNSYRCGRADGQGGHTRVCSADSVDGVVVLAPDASLRNVGTASVAWHPKFSAPAPPYANDQHPYLVWNLYRLDPDGSLRQVGVSAAKHAFNTINAACGCAGGEILYPGCEDTYGGFSNDYPTALAPRAEIIPHTAQWGRCGSLYDKDCNGQRDPDNGIVADDAYSPLKRMGVRESEISPALHPGSRWFLEYWYVVREDIDPWNTIGLIEVQPAKVRGQGADPTAYVWRFGVLDFRNGPMLDMWTAQAPGANWTRTSRINTTHGRAILAVTVVPQGNDRYRYEYVFFNLDFAITQTAGAEPNLRVSSNRGFDSFALAIADGAHIEASEFEPVSGTSIDWTLARVPPQLVWTAGNALTLEWGRSFRYSFISDLPPIDSVAFFGAGAERWTARTLAPTTSAPVVRRRSEVP